VYAEAYPGIFCGGTGGVSGLKSPAEVRWAWGKAKTPEARDTELMTVMCHSHSLSQITYCSDSNYTLKRISSYEYDGGRGTISHLALLLCVHVTS